MPYPAQINRDTLIETAAQLIEKEGVDHLTLARLAAVMGVKAPSLYRYVRSRDALIQAIVTLTLQRLFAAYDAALETAVSDPAELLLALLHAHRIFAHLYPHNYVLAFTTTIPEQRADESALEQLVLPIQALMAAISGPAESLAALRGALALVHGFVMLELNQQFRRGGDLTAAFDAAVRAYLVGWQRPQ